MESENKSCLSFSRNMRSATRDVHKVSDMLVNAKLGFALSDDKVWADGLLVFYEIFKYLENNVPEAILPSEYHRTHEFESDLSFYLGHNWKVDYIPRKAVCEYLQHLEKLQSKDPILLIAYVYHLYMGMMSGGQILQKKRKLANKLNPFSTRNNSSSGMEITNYANVFEMKKNLRSLIDEFCNDLDDDTKKALLEESQMVFKLNNKIVASVKGVNAVNSRRIFMLSCFSCVVAIFYYLLFY